MFLVGTCHKPAAPMLASVRNFSPRMLCRMRSCSSMGTCKDVGHRLAGGYGNRRTCIKLQNIHMYMPASQPSQPYLFGRLVLDPRR